MDNVVTSSTGSKTKSGANSLRKVTVASMVGTVIEWFDFNLFGAMAALVLGPLFFPSANPLTSTLLSLATFGVAFVARPIGGVLFGHFGDRYGRKRALIIALVGMGTGTFAIGLLPTYASIGLAAPILLVTLRLLQGLALGGEYGGAVLMVVEHEGAAKRRGFFGAWLGSASPLGYILAAGLIALTTTVMPEQSFTSWGWRVPFLLSAVMVIVGLYIRLSIEESAAFKEVVEQSKTPDVAKVPFVEMFKRYPRSVFSSIGAALAIHAGYYMSIIFGLSYARNYGRFTAASSLALILLASVLYFFAILAAGHLSDKIGRKPPMIFGGIGFACWVFAMYPMIASGNVWLGGAAFAVALVFLGFLYGPMSTWLAELFGTQVRYTGISFGYNLAGVLGGGVTPALAVSLMNSFGSAVPVAVLAAAVTVVSLVTVVFTRGGLGHQHNDLNSL